MERYFINITTVGNGSCIYYWKSKGLSDERINPIKTSNHSITPNLSYYGTKTRVEFNGRCLKKDKTTFNQVTIANIYIVYEISRNYNISSYPTLENCLFGAVSWTKHAVINQYKYFGQGIGFDRHGFFSHPNGGTGNNVVIFGVDDNSSTKIDNR